MYGPKDDGGIARENCNPLKAVGYSIPQIPMMRSTCYQINGNILSIFFLFPLQVSYWTKCSYCLNWSHHFESFASPRWLGRPLWKICVTNYHGYVPLVVNTSRSFPHSWLITGFVTRLARRVPLFEQELPTFPVYNGVRVTRSLVVCPFSFNHCVICPSSIYGLWLLLWYLQSCHWQHQGSFKVTFAYMEPCIITIRFFITVFTNPERISNFAIAGFLFPCKILFGVKF